MPRVINAVGISEPELFRLIIQLYEDTPAGLPQNFELMWCSPNTTENEISLFLERMAHCPGSRFMAINVNALPHALRDLVLKFQLLLGPKKGNIYYIFTSLTGLEGFLWLKTENFASGKTIIVPSVSFVI